MPRRRSFLPILLLLLSLLLPALLACGDGNEGEPAPPPAAPGINPLILL